MNSFNLYPQQIASYFICSIDREAGDSLTHLKLQKLLYYAQAWSMVFFEKTLFEEDFQAWSHGPVLPSIWEKYKKFGHENIETDDSDHHLPQNIIELLEEIKEVYGEKSAKYLENLSHSEKPWIEARQTLPLEQRSTTAISKKTMRHFYFELHQNLNANAQN